MRVRGCEEVEMLKEMVGSADPKNVLAFPVDAELHSCLDALSCCFHGGRQVA